jgi:parallel beta-helix repeat protein
MRSAGKSGITATLLVAVVLVMTATWAMGVTAVTGGKSSIAVLHAGSVDMLAHAVQKAGPGGTVLVLPGIHHESGTVMITAPVSILGRGQAVIETGSAAAMSFPLRVEAAIHVKGTSGVEISGLTLRPAAGLQANTAFLVEDSTDVLISANDISAHQVGILIQRGDGAVVEGNTISLLDGWRIRELPASYGIVNISGSGVRITGNRVQNGLYGLWISGIGGVATGNTMTDGYIGMVFCRVPERVFMIEEALEGSTACAIGWQVSENLAAGNMWGYLLVDSSSQNTLSDNAAVGNGVYDLELSGDGHRMGMDMEGTHENLVQQRAGWNLLVKNCGSDNSIVGGTLVDTTVDSCFTHVGELPTVTLDGGPESW